MRNVQKYKLLYECAPQHIHIASTEATTQHFS